MINTFSKFSATFRRSNYKRSIFKLLLLFDSLLIRCYYFTIHLPRLLIAAHNKSPARLSEAYLCIVYFYGDYVWINFYLTAKYFLQLSNE